MMAMVTMIGFMSMVAMIGVIAMIAMVAIKSLSSEGRSLPSPHGRGEYIIRVKSPDTLRCSGNNILGA